MQHDEQYIARWAPQTVPWQMRQRKDQPGLELRLSDSGKDYLAFEEPLPDLGWTLTLTADSKVVTQARQQEWVLATLASGLLVLGALYWQLRERRLQENRQVRIEPEQCVVERTHALQQAQALRQSMEDSQLVGSAASELIGCLPPYP